VARYPVPAVAAAASTTTVLGPAAAAGGSNRSYRISRVEYSADGAITGQATNFRTLRLVNKGPAGSLTIILAQLDLNAGGINVRQRFPREIPLLVATGETRAAVREGDQVQWESVPTGTGLADPGGAVLIVEEAI
jgi:hypothetical protein